MALISPIVDIALVSFAMALVSQLLQRKLVDRKKMKENQAQMKIMQKRIQELARQNDEKSKNEATRLQNEMLHMMNESMKGSMKHMIVSLPIFFVVLGVLAAFYSHQLVNLPVPLIVFHRNPEFFNLPTIFDITANVSYLWWYFYCSLISSLFLAGIFKAFKKI